MTITDVGTGGAGSFLDATRGWAIWTSPFGGIRQLRLTLRRRITLLSADR